MSASRIIARAADAGVSLRIVGDNLRVRASSRPPEALLDDIRSHKAEIIAWLGVQSYEARQVEWLNSNPAPSMSDCCAHCAAFEEAYDPLLPFGLAESRKAEAASALAAMGVGVSPAPTASVQPMTSHYAVSPASGLPRRSSVPTWRGRHASRTAMELEGPAEAAGGRDGAAYGLVAENRSLLPVSLAANPEGIAAGEEQSRGFTSIMEPEVQWEYRVVDHRAGLDDNLRDGQSSRSAKIDAQSFRGH